MIWTKILNFFINLVIWLLSLLPDLNFMVSISSYIQPVANFVSYIDSFVSVSLIASCITVILVYDNWRFVWAALNFVWDKLPFI